MKMGEVNNILKIVRQKWDQIEHKYDEVGRNVAYKLRKLSRETTIISEKLILNISFEA